MMFTSYSAGHFPYLYLRFDRFNLALQSADYAVDLAHLALHHAELVSILTGLHRHLVKLHKEEGQHHFIMDSCL